MCGVIPAWSADEWAAVLGAVASLLWPAILVVALVLFRRQLRDFISRSDEIQTPIGTLRAQPLDPGPVEQVKRQLPRSSDASSSDAATPEEEADTEDESTSPEYAVPREADITREVLDLASRDVRVAFIRLLDSLEERIRDLAAASGAMDPHTPRWQDLLDDLVEKGVIPRGVASNVTLLDSMRNAVIHEGYYWESEALTAIDGGLDLLTALDGIPIQGYEVVDPNVTLYRDPECRESWDVTGVIVRQQKSRGRRGPPQGPYPTRKVYEPGDLVGWQWSFEEKPIDCFWPDSDGTVQKIRSSFFAGEPLRGSGDRRMSPVR